MHILHQVWMDVRRERNAIAARGRNKGYAYVKPGFGWTCGGAERNAVGCGAREDRPIRQGRGYADPNNKALLTPLSLSLHSTANVCTANSVT